MEFAKLQAPTLKELFIASVENKILSGEMKIGSKLPTERELAEMMGVSRGVVNSGIAEMARKGFLEVKPRIGTFVADYRRVGTVDILLSIMHFNGGDLPMQEVRSLIEFKLLIDCFSVRNVIQRKITDEQAEKLVGYIDQIRKSEDIHEISILVHAFNLELSYLSGNTFAPLIYNSFKTANVNLGERYLRRYGKESLCQYGETLLVHILNADEESAVNWIAGHSKELMNGKYQIYNDTQTADFEKWR